MASDFKYFTPGFQSYNVAQRSVLPWLDKDVNLVISFATASGKTVLAECAMAYHLQMTGENVAYVCPFRSLASEKKRTWDANPQLSKYGIAVASGDSEWSPSQCFRINLFTNESFSAKVRSQSYAAWLSTLQCVIIDEAHLLGDKRRGAAIESAIMGLTRIAPGCRLILLSATLPNARALAQWVKSVNGKETKSIVSNWRANKVVYEYVLYESAQEREEETLASIKQLSGKTLVFVQSIAYGKRLLKLVRALGMGCSFHHAGQTAKMRQRIEEAFADRLSGLDVLISTSTLSTGVNTVI
jgi:helicase